MMAARVEYVPSFRVSEPRRLFSGNFMGGSDMGRSFDLTADGRRFLMVRLPPGVAQPGFSGYAPRLIVVQNWFKELEALLRPAK
ncbi:MAG: hypothetical protein ACT4QD_09690 [Acidobacteriota bacterium]